MALPRPDISIASRYIESQLSDLQPTSLVPEAVVHLNRFADELVAQLITSAQSINPAHIRNTGVPAVFRAERNDVTGIRNLGRIAVSAAQMDVGHWQTSPDGVGHARAFGNDGQGNGMRNGASLALKEAIDMVRGKVAEFASCSDQEPPTDMIQRIKAFERAGGITADVAIVQSALFLASFTENIIEEIMKQLGRVVGRDGNYVGTVQDLYTALAEDVALWGFYRRFECKSLLEEAVRPKKRSQPPRSSADSYPSARLSENAKQAPSSFDKGISSSTLRKSPSLSSARSKRNEHERSGSALSINTRNMLGAFNQQAEDSHPSQQEELQDFDELMRSGETMKVSLTPNRLKAYDGVQGASYKKPVVAKSTIDHTRTQKLQARDARSIAEEKEEEQHNRRPKESLMDLLAGDKEFSSPPKQGERIAPAVILQTAPSHFSPSARGRQVEDYLRDQNKSRFELPPGVAVQSVNRPERPPQLGNYADYPERETGITSPKRKTATQEMADFFNTPPPGPSHGRTDKAPPLASSAALAAAMSSSTRGFKSFIRKLGKRSESKENLQLGKGISSSDLVMPTHPDRSAVAEYRSQFSSASKSPSSPTDTAARQYAKSFDHKSGYTDEQITSSKTVPTSASLVSFPRTIDAPPLPSLPDDFASSALPTIEASPKRTSSLSASVSKPIVSGTSERSLSASLVTGRDLGSVDRQSSTDMMSFMTAKETQEVVTDLAGDSLPNNPASLPLTDNVVPESTIEQEVDVEPAGDHTALEPALKEPDDPTIPLSSLSWLYASLTHAETARECHLILFSALRQMRVPVPNQDDMLVIGPEERVAGWLLGGVLGPEGEATGLSRRVPDQPSTDAIPEAAGLPAPHASSLPVGICLPAQARDNERQSIINTSIETADPAASTSVDSRPTGDLQPTAKRQDPLREAQRRARIEARKSRIANLHASGVEDELGM